MRPDHSVDRYVDRLRRGDSCFHTFIDRPGLAAGVLVLAPGEDDPQGPHDSDEVYFVVRGDGFLEIDGRDHGVSAGMAFFVAAGAPHSFHGNSEELVAVYFFGGRGA